MHSYDNLPVKLGKDDEDDADDEELDDGPTSPDDDGPSPLSTSTGTCIDKFPQYPQEQSASRLAGLLWQGLLFIHPLHLGSAEKAEHVAPLPFTRGICVFGSQIS